MNDRRDTCRGEGCPFWTRYGKNCPNYVEGDWTSKKDGHKYITKDCGPKRSMILTQQIYDAIIDQRIDYAHVRKAMVKVAQIASSNIGVEFIEGEFEDAKLIEDKTDGKDTDQ